MNVANSENNVCETIGEADDMDNEDIYTTQPCDEIDKSIYLEIKAKLGSKDKTSFIDSIQDIYNHNIKEINDVKESLYDYAKQTCVNFPAGLLVRRKNTQATTAPAIYKCAQDVYYLYHYIEGTIPAHVLQTKVLSRASVRHLSMSTPGTPSTANDVTNVNTPIKINSTSSSSTTPTERASGETNYPGKG
ncbi:uncharacterized protein LOC124261896 [Haliotis rubra]|uniref:uncharacterized protein LOC124261896 n=1 Tax=Haliotis rubra TaxID=36100 RepID=UPI001EE5FD15|nr:uncharacterized protein LOC124261896 [Haliotis rubra]